jgi:hypothetical protein
MQSFNGSNDREGSEKVEIVSGGGWDGMDSGTNKAFAVMTQSHRVGGSGNGMKSVRNGGVQTLGNSNVHEYPGEVRSVSDADGNANLNPRLVETVIDEPTGKPKDGKSGKYRPRGLAKVEKCENSSKRPFWGKKVGSICTA